MISVIILTNNSEKYIKGCLDSLLRDANEAHLQLEVFVFDNGSTDSTAQLIENNYKNTKNFFLEKFTTNKGTTMPRNLGIKKAKGEYILFLDSDTIVKSGALKGMLDMLNKEKSFGIVCPSLEFEDGRSQESVRKFPTIYTKVLRFLNKKFGFFDKALQKDESYIVQSGMSVDYAISACWLVKREVFDMVGMFDENIFYSPEDIDFCIRVHKAHLEVVFCGEALVVHFVQQASYKKIHLAFSHLMGLVYLFRKHSYFFSREKLYKSFR
ncbi:glycosyltransferase [Patescibacteria group bacterium]|nr:glycosyltransferase [Patescibacteria group bacterium]